MTVEQIQDYFAVLVETHSWSTVKVDRNGLQFFWRHVLKREWDWVSIVRPPKVTTLPDVFTCDEVNRLIATAEQLRYRVFILTTYSLGLRLSETLNLNVGDIDAARQTVHIRRGKGHKDRLLPLPNITLQALRHLWVRHHNPVWLFPNAVGSAERMQQATSHMDRGGTQQAVKAIIRACGIKKISIHSLHHSFATHLLEAGLSTRQIQHLLGHSDPRTTEIYTRLATQWLERQKRKLIPVDYFLVTFTVPSELRAVFWQKQRLCFDALMQCAAQTLTSFARRAGAKGGDCGITAVLHTHSRRLDFHPHVHLIVPAGFIQRDKMRWIAAKTKYLFHHKNLAKVFRAKLLERLKKHALELPTNMPTVWIVDCRHVGDGRPALEYLSRYLYRGVLMPKNITENRDGNVSFRYTDAQSKQPQTRSLNGADFLWLLLQHILPRGFQRVRNYGYLHHNNKTLLATVQLRLKVQLPATVPLTKPALLCRQCGCALKTQRVLYASQTSTVPQPHAPTLIKTSN